MRPTALIRRMLQIEYLQKELTREMRAVKQELRDRGVTVIEVENRPLDVRVHYKVNERHQEALFMTPMLYAEVEGGLRRWLGEIPE
ncbi:hypothetical protein [Kyrpidia sp.]|uniref:hypothetical protein n=1 Tax=Kyrpidia sp. TaxID=2073077 RepID=UPI00184392CD|nr:hypothetical protein [Kyrpidia sp.]MCL6575687.1 hypothetical protein [Kyrpidia sp.]HHY67801.1 hypothetical protein [Alicyclobacillus sp.]